MAGNDRYVNCAKCNFPINIKWLDEERPYFCANCQYRVKARIFPAFFKAQESGKNGDAMKSEEEASCFYHSQKKASVVCLFCGRFICELCKLSLDGKNICTKCFEVGVNKQKFEQLENRRVLYDNIAFYVAFYPMLLIYPTLISAPIAIYLSIRYWKTPLSIVGRTKVRFVAAFILGGMQISGWILLFYQIFT